MLGRLKFDIDTLVNQMLDQLPEDVIIQRHYIRSCNWWRSIC